MGVGNASKWTPSDLMETGCCGKSSPDALHVSFRDTLKIYGNNAVSFTCSVLVSPHGFKKDIHFMSSLLVWPHGRDMFSLSLTN